MSIIVVLPVKAQNRTLRVPEDFESISAAINSAADGDTIYIKSGTYQEQVLTINKTISLIGEDAKTTIMSMHPPSKPFLNSNLLVYDNPIEIIASQVTISGFTIISDGGAISAHGKDNEISGNYIKTPISVKGNETRILNNKIESEPTSLHIFGQNNTIANNTLMQGGIYLEGTWNRILDNSITQRQLYNETGIVLTGSINIISGNTVVNGSVYLSGESNSNIIAKNNCHDLLISRSYNNTVTANHLNGILAFLGSNNVFHGNYMHGLLLGNQYMDAPDNVFYENIFDFTNGKRIYIYLGVVNSLILDDGKVGNYWSDDTSTSGAYIIYLAQGNSQSPSTYRLSDENDYELTLTDRHPLKTIPDISKIQVQLPQWADPTMDSQNATPPPTLPLTETVVAIIAVSIALVGIIMIIRLKRRSHTEFP